MNGSRPPFHTRLYDFAACRELDRLTAAAGFPEQQLMGQAALASCHALLGRIRTSVESGGRIVVLCGTGNNGGDGYALTYMLLGARPSLRHRLSIVATGEPRSDAARFYAARVRDCAVPLAGPSEFTGADLGPRDLLVEAVLGIGQTESPRGEAASIAAAVSRARGAMDFPQLVSLDVPIGLCENRTSYFAAPGQSRNRLPPPAESQSVFPLPDEIHSYGVEKLALRMQPELAAHSQILVLPMGFLPEPEAQEHEPAGARLFRVSAAGENLAHRPLDHKYSAGHAVLAGGSAGMEGALLLAARAFFAAGGGILNAFTSADAEHTWATYPAVMFQGLGALSAAKLPAVVAVGPGASAEDGALIRDQLLRFFARAREARTAAPLVIVDAGALPFARDLAAGLDAEKENMLLTPHQGEWERLGGPAPNCVEGLSAAAAFNREAFGCYTLVKGPVSCLLGPHGETFVCSAPNRGLSVAGSGDVLVGILAAVGSRRETAPRSIPEIVEAGLSVQSLAGLATANPDGLHLIDAIRALIPGTQET